MEAPLVSGRATRPLIRLNARRDRSTAIGASALPPSSLVLLPPPPECLRATRSLSLVQADPKVCSTYFYKVVKETYVMFILALALNN